MSSYNHVTLLGNVTRDPQIKHLPSNTTVAEWGLAMNRKFKTQSGEAREEVCFVDCAAFGKAAEVIGQYVRKGKQLLVSGRLKFDSWDDKMGGGKRSKLSVVVEEFQFIGSRDDGDSAPREQGQQPRAPAKEAAPAEMDQQAFTEADIPF